MRRFLMALVVLFTATTTPAFAGYIIIRVLLEGSSGGPSVDIPGGPGGFQPGGEGYSPKGGPPPSSSGPGGKGGKGGSMAGPPSPPPGGMSGMPSGPMTPGAPAHHGHADIDHSRAIVVVIPLETDFTKKKMDPNKADNPQNNPLFRHIDFQHQGQKYGASLFIDSSTIQLYEELLGTPAPKKTRGTEVHDKHNAWVRTKNDPRLLYDAMDLALRSGFVKEALAYAKELLAVAAENKLALPERDVKPFVAAWGKMAGAVTGVTTQPSDAELWRDRLDLRNSSVTVVEHYAIISSDSSSTEVKRRATQLNDNFAAFYLWHATRGIVLPVPEKPLVAVLAPQAASMRALNLALDGLPMADAFFAPDHNLLVLSPERMDDVGQSFLRQNQQVFVKGLNREQLLTGQIPKLDHTGQKGSRPEDVAYAATLAAVEKLAVEEAEIAAVSREGTRQLLYATGTLPKHVTLPTWLTNGAVNFFTRPRGPAYVTVGEDDKPYMHVAVTTGYGGPNYVLQRYFRDLDAKKELPATAERLLENVLGDVYFNGIKNGDDPDPAPPKKAKKPVTVAQAPVQPGPGGMGMGPNSPRPSGPGGMGPRPGGGASSAGPPPGGVADGGEGNTPRPGVAGSDFEDPAVALRKKQQRLAIKANATSWALYYYLAKAKPEQLKEYVSELNRLPRDLPIDGRTAYDVFVRVFKLSTSEDGSADPKEVKKFADEWLTYISTVPLVGFDVPLVVPVALPGSTGGPMGPGPTAPAGGGGRPGGSGGSGGGGSGSQPGSSG